MACIQNSVVRNVVALDESASCADAARVMAQQAIGSVAVRRGPRLVGVVTERDLVAALVGRADPARTPLREAMPAGRPAVSIQASDAECAELMRQHRTRHLAVRDGAEIVGIISMLDLAGLVVEEKEWSIDALESYIRGGRAGQLSEPLSTPFSHEAVARLAG